MNSRNEALELVESGLVSAEQMLSMCLAYMSEAAVEDMMRDNYLVEDEEDGDE